jgi:hypothetical protein
MTARSHNTDYLQVFRFHAIVRLAGDAEEDPLEVYREEQEGGGAKGIAGFTEATLPGYDIEQAEHHTGIKNLPEKQAGKVSMSGDVSLTRGMVPQATKFLDWAYAYLRGEEYRGTLLVYQWSQKEAPSTRPQHGATNEPNLEAARIYRYHQATPSSVGQTDLSADSSDIQMEELEIAVEDYEINPHRD